MKQKKLNNELGFDRGKLRREGETKIGRIKQRENGSFG